MTGLYIFLGIVGFIVLLLSIRITVNGEFFDEFKLNIKWLFVKIDILPAQKKDKPKKEKAPKEKKEKPSTEDVAPETPTEKKENIFVKFYNNQGFDGVIQLLNNVGKALGKLMHSFKKHIVLRELYLWLTVTGGCDAAETALEYGRVCQKVFPALSFICTNLTVKKYDVEIEPDFLGSKNTAQFAFSVSVRPIFILNALIVLVFRLLIKVVLKFLMGIKDKSKNNENINEGGAL
ncbi:MAG: DUF2953 domain-containing protein [Clostridia bacterium]|nr:DUF2953 domain-containing protein [Clostridia bacterium]MBR5191267.1 DUF2953 domain-containing protein [Clostridia bacterium]